MPSSTSKGSQSQPAEFSRESCTAALGFPSILLDLVVEEKHLECGSAAPPGKIPRAGVIQGNSRQEESDPSRWKIRGIFKGNGISRKDGAVYSRVWKNTMSGILGIFMELKEQPQEFPVKVFHGKLRVFLVRSWMWLWILKMWERGFREFPGASVLDFPSWNLFRIGDAP